MKHSHLLIKSNNHKKSKTVSGLFSSRFFIICLTFFLVMLNLSYAEKPSKRDLIDQNEYNANSGNTAKFIHAERESRIKPSNTQVDETPVALESTVTVEETPVTPESTATVEETPITPESTATVDNTSTTESTVNEQPASSLSACSPLSEGKTASCFKASSLTQFGITWTFDQEYQVGTFANGDYWVLGPVKITKITPQSISGDRIMNGSMINPFGINQGYDSAMYGIYAREGNYDDKLNVALNVSGTNSLIIEPGNSLVSTISIGTAENRPQLETASILTVLKSVPIPGSFRPPYTGTDKTIRYNKNELDYSKLRTLPLIDTAQNPDILANNFEKPWIDHVPSWTGRYIHPKQNMPDYGREIANLIGYAGLSLMLDYSAQEKEKLLIRLVQFGIDTYGLAKMGLTWPDLGGHMHGRKLPVLLAGVVLNNQDMINMANGENNLIFQEDLQTWFITENDVGREVTQYDNKLRESYLPEDVGMPEWGEQHTTWENRDDRRWEAAYRNNVGSSILGHILTARLLGAETLWNWPSLFSYSDRFWEIEKSHTIGPNIILPFTREMWIKYSACAKYQCK